MKTALGATPARIARELLVERLVLGSAGGVLGSGLAYLGLHALVAIGPSELPRLQEIGIYPPVLAFTAAASFASTLVFAPLLRSSRHCTPIRPSSARRAARARAVNGT